MVFFLLVKDTCLVYTNYINNHHRLLTNDDAGNDEIHDVVGGRASFESSG